MSERTQQPSEVVKKVHSSMTNDNNVSTRGSLFVIDCGTVWTNH
jgi:hypothetical protein